jgi:hypothetical protein
MHVYIFNCLFCARVERLELTSPPCPSLLVPDNRERRRRNRGARSLQCADRVPRDMRSRRALAKEVAASKVRRTSCGIGTITIAKGGGERGGSTIKATFATFATITRRGIATFPSPAPGKTSASGPCRRRRPSSGGMSRRRPRSVGTPHRLAAGRGWGVRLAADRGQEVRLDVGQGREVRLVTGRGRGYASP